MSRIGRQQSKVTGTARDDDGLRCGIALGNEIRPAAVRQRPARTVCRKPQASGASLPLRWTALAVWTMWSTSPLLSTTASSGQHAF